MTAAWSLYDQLQRLTPASSRAAPNAFARVSNLALNTAQGLSTLKASKGNDRDSDQANKQGRKGKVVVGGEDGGEATGQISEHLLTVRVVRDAREAVEDLAGKTSPLPDLPHILSSSSRPRTTPHLLILTTYPISLCNDVGRFVAAATSHLTSAVARAVEEHVAESNKAQKGSESKLLLQCSPY